MSQDINTGIPDAAYNSYLLKCKELGIKNPASKAQLEGAGAAKYEEDEAVDTKICKECKEEKDIDEFYVNRQLKDGHENICKECKKEKARKPDIKLPERPELVIIDDPAPVSKVQCMGPAQAPSRATPRDDNPVQYMSVAQAKAFVRQAYALGVDHGRCQIEIAEVTLDELLAEEGAQHER